MHHAGIQYGQGSMSSQQQQQQQQPQQQQQQFNHTEISASSGVSTTSTLRQWRKREAEKPPVPENGSEAQGPIARVAPHAHYPRTNDIYTYPQFPDYGLQYKEMSPTPVKYSEIVEPSGGHHLSHQMPKSKELLEMCTMQQNQLKQYPNLQMMQGHYAMNQKESHQYLQKEQSGFPQYIPGYKIPNQYPRQYPNDFQIPLYNQDRLQDPALYQNPSFLYQNRTMYRNYHRQQQPPQQYPNYNYKPNETYRVPPYPQKFPQMPHIEPLPGSISSRRIYQEGLYRPNYNCNQLEYAQHYQNRMKLQQDCQEPKLFPSPTQMPDVVSDTAKSSLKQYLETWNDEPENQDEEKRSQNLYIIDSTEIPTESIQQYIHLQVDKLPENIKGFLNDSVIKDGNSVIRTKDTSPQISVISENKKFPKNQPEEQNTVIVYNNHEDRRKEEESFSILGQHLMKLPKSPPALNHNHPQEKMVPVPDKLGIPQDNVPPSCMQQNIPPKTALKENIPRTITTREIDDCTPIHTPAIMVPNNELHSSKPLEKSMDQTRILKEEAFPEEVLKDVCKPQVIQEVVLEKGAQRDVEKDVAGKFREVPVEVQGRSLSLIEDSNCLDAQSLAFNKSEETSEEKKSGEDSCPVNKPVENAIKSLDFEENCCKTEDIGDKNAEDLSMKKDFVENTSTVTNFEEEISQAIDLVIKSKEPKVPKFEDKSEFAEEIKTEEKPNDAATKRKPSFGLILGSILGEIKVPKEETEEKFEQDHSDDLTAPPTPNSDLVPQLQNDDSNSMNLSIEKELNGAIVELKQEFVCSCEIDDCERSEEVLDEILKESLDLVEKNGDVKSSDDSDVINTVNLEAEQVVEDLKEHEDTELDKIVCDEVVEEQTVMKEEIDVKIREDVEDEISMGTDEKELTKLQLIETSVIPDKVSEEEGSNCVIKVEESLRKENCVETGVTNEVCREETSEVEGNISGIKEKLEDTTNVEDVISLETEEILEINAPIKEENNDAPIEGIPTEDNSMKKEADSNLNEEFPLRTESPVEDSVQIDVQSSEDITTLVCDKNHIKEESLKLEENDNIEDIPVTDIMLEDQEVCSEETLDLELEANKVKDARIEEVVAQTLVESVVEHNVSQEEASSGEDHISQESLSCNQIKVEDISNRVPLDAAVQTCPNLFVCQDISIKHEVAISTEDLTQMSNPTVIQEPTVKKEFLQKLEDKLTQTTSTLLDKPTQTVSTLENKPTQTISNLEDKPTQTISNLEDKPTQTTNSSVPKSIQTTVNQSTKSVQTEESKPTDFTNLNTDENKILLQISGELLEINVVTTQGKKFISVIPYTDCTVITETNNNTIVESSPEEEEEFGFDAPFGPAEEVVFEEQVHEIEIGIEEEVVMKSEVEMEEAGERFKVGEEIFVEDEKKLIEEIVLEGALKKLDEELVMEDVDGLEKLDGEVGLKAVVALKELDEEIVLEGVDNFKTLDGKVVSNGVIALKELDEEIVFEDNLKKLDGKIVPECVVVLKALDEEIVLGGVETLKKIDEVGKKSIAEEVQAELELETMKFGNQKIEEENEGGNEVKAKAKKNLEEINILENVDVGVLGEVKSTLVKIEEDLVDENKDIEKRKDPDVGVLGEIKGSLEKIKEDLMDENKDIENRVSMERMRKSSVIEEPEVLNANSMENIAEEIRKIRQEIDSEKKVNENIKALKSKNLEKLGTNKKKEENKYKKGVPRNDENKKRYVKAVTEKEVKRIKNIVENKKKRSLKGVDKKKEDSKKRLNNNLKKSEAVAGKKIVKLEERKLNGNVVKESGKQISPNANKPPVNENIPNFDAPKAKFVSTKHNFSIIQKRESPVIKFPNTNKKLASLAQLTPPQKPPTPKVKTKAELKETPRPINIPIPKVLELKQPPQPIEMPTPNVQKQAMKVVPKPSPAFDPKKKRLSLEEYKRKRTNSDPSPDKSPKKINIGLEEKSSGKEFEEQQWQRLSLNESWNKLDKHFGLPPIRKQVVNENENVLVKTVIEKEELGKENKTNVDPRRKPEDVKTTVTNNNIVVERKSENVEKKVCVIKENLTATPNEETSSTTLDAPTENSQRCFGQDCDALAKRISSSIDDIFIQTFRKDKQRPPYKKLNFDLDSLNPLRPNIIQNPKPKKIQNLIDLNELLPTIATKQPNTPTVECENRALVIQQVKSKNSGNEDFLGRNQCDQLERRDSVIKESSSILKLERKVEDLKKDFGVDEEKVKAVLESSLGSTEDIINGKIESVQKQGNCDFKENVVVIVDLKKDFLGAKNQLDVPIEDVMIGLEVSKCSEEVRCVGSYQKDAEMFVIKENRLIRREESCEVGCNRTNNVSTPECSRNDFGFKEDLPKLVGFKEVAGRCDMEEEMPVLSPQNVARRLSIDDISKRLMDNKTETSYVRCNSEDLKLHLKKVPEAENIKIHIKLSPVPKPEKVSKKSTKRNRKRFRNLHSADEEVEDYSVFETQNQTGLPKLIIKRNVCESRDSSLQPFVRIQRDPDLDTMAKKKKKYF